MTARVAVIETVGAQHDQGERWQCDVGQNPPSAEGTATAVVATLRAVQAVAVADVD